MVMRAKAKQKREFLRIVKVALKEDIGRGDITSEPIFGNGERVLGIIFAKEDGILCGVELARLVFKEIDETIDFQNKLSDGEKLAPGMTIATIIGPALSCLKGERTALNFLQHLSGIATLTKKFVELTKGSIKILDTRKTLPGLRFIEKYAVRVGGGYNHRLGLYDAVLIKDNHIEIAGSISNAVKKLRKRKKRVFIEVEVKTFDELREAINLKVNRIMIDNMNQERIAQAVKLIRESGQKIEIEVSGGIGLKDIPELAQLGIDYVSVGSLTHSAPALDIALKMKSLGRGAN